ncbi:TPA: hypothetical protein ACT5CJ_002392 [Flavobacterium psychrophilum]
MNNIISVHEKRELNKLGLESFFLDIENNSYDSISQKVILNLEEKLSKIYNDYDDENLNYDWDSYFLVKELEALSEMKIIYAFKHFETGLKFLINASYNVTDKSKMYKWEFISDFLKSKKIDIKKVKGYSEINELRNVNNSIKHSQILDSKSLPKEFQNKTKIEHTDILNFYKRIEDSPKLFLSNLSDLIFDDLYVFDEKRIDSIAEKFMLRMEQKDIKLLVEKLTEKY